MRRIELLGTPMDVASMAETVNCINKSVAEGRFIQHVVVNVAKLMNMRTDPELRKSVTSCDIINIDGMGVVFGARFLGHDVRERVAGVDLFEALLQMSAQQGYPVYLLGAEEHIVAEVAKRASTSYPNLIVAGFHHGYFWENERAVVERIRSSKAKLLFVAITSPKKENFINRWKSDLGVNFVMGVGGTFDVVAGKVRRAPTWMQRYGFEWLFRVLQEPMRLWRRYMKTNLQFGALLLRERFRV